MITSSMARYTATRALQCFHVRDHEKHQGDVETKQPPPRQLHVAQFRQMVPEEKRVGENINRDAAPAHAIWVHQSRGCCCRVFHKNAAASMNAAISETATSETTRLNRLCRSSVRTVNKEILLGADSWAKDLRNIHPLLFEGGRQDIERRKCKSDTNRKRARSKEARRTANYRQDYEYKNERIIHHDRRGRIGQPGCGNNHSQGSCRTPPLLFQTQRVQNQQRDGAPPPTTQRTHFANR